MPLPRKLKIETLESRRLLTVFTELGGNNSPGSAQILLGSPTLTVKGHDGLTQGDDYFRFYAIEGEKVKVTATPASSGKSMAFLVSQPGNGISEVAGGGDQGDPAAPNRSFTVPSTGWWEVGVYAGEETVEVIDFGGGNVIEVPVWKRSTGSYTLQIENAADFQIESVVATFDEEPDPAVFGDYLPAVSLENEFTITTNVELPKELAVQYQFGKGGLKTATGSGLEFEFDQDMGMLKEDESQLSVMIVAQGDGKQIAKETSRIRFHKDLEFELNFEIGQESIGHEDVRWIGSEISEGVSAVTAKLDSSLPFFEQYKSQPLDLITEDKGSRATIGLSPQSDGRWTAQTYNVTVLRDTNPNGKDYRVDLTGTELSQPPHFTKSNELLVISIPDWMKQIGVEEKEYEDGQYRLDLQGRGFSKEVPLNLPTDLVRWGLVDPSKIRSAVDADFEIVVTAPVSVRKDPVLEVTSASAKATLLGKELGTVQLDDQIKVESKLDNSNLKFEKNLRISNRNPISLGTPSSPLSSSFKLPSVLEKGLDAVAGPLVSVGGSFQASVSPNPITMNVSAELEVSNNRIRWVKSGSFVELQTSITASASANAELRLLTIPGLQSSLANITARGGINAALAGKVRVDVDGPMQRPSINLNSQETALKLGLYWDILVEASVLFDLVTWELVKLTSDGVKTYTLLGSGNLNVNVSTETGTGISSSGAGSNGAGQKNKSGSGVSTRSLSVQGTLKLLELVPPTFDELAIQLIGSADRPTLTPGQHRVDVVLVGTQSEVALHSIDLASWDYNKSDGESTLPYVTDSNQIRITPDMATLDPSEIYQLEFRLVTDDEVAENVFVQLIEADVSQPNPSVELSMPQGPVTQPIQFGPDTNGASVAHLSLRNTSVFPISIAGVELVGPGFRLSSDDDEFLRPGDDYEVFVEILDPTIASEAQLIYRLDQGTEPIAVVELRHDPTTPLDEIQPRVDAIQLRSLGWSDSRPSIDTTESLGYSDLNQVILVFSEDVLIQQDDLQLTGSASGHLAASEFEYQAESNEAVWTFANAFGHEKFRLELTDVVLDRAGNSLDPSTTDEFDILPGDANSDGAVEFSDFLLLSGAFGNNSAMLSAGDFNGDSRTDFADFLILSAQFGTNIASFPSPNHRPQFRPVPKESYVDDTEIVIPLFATDKDPMDTLTYGLITAPEHTDIDAATGLLRFEPHELTRPTNYFFEVVVEDDAALQGTERMAFEIQVFPRNLAPTLVAPSPVSVEQDGILLLPLRATDPNAPWDDLEYEIVRGPDGVEIDNRLGLLIWEPGSDVTSGSYEIEVQVADTFVPQLKDSAVIVVDVIEKPRTPLLVPIPDQTVVEGSELQFSVSLDAPNPTETVRFELGDGAPDGATLDSASGEFSWVPQETDGPGTFFVTIVAEDSKSLRDELVVSISVEEENAAPVLTTFTDQTAYREETFEISIEAGDSDVPVNDLTYALVEGPEGMILDPESGQLTWLPTDTQMGSHSVTIRVSDDGAEPLTDQFTFSITVADERTPPAIRAELSSGLARTVGPFAEITGTVEDASEITSFMVAIGEGPVEDYSDVTETLSANGDFLLSQELLESINGSPLNEGTHRLHFQATDALGNVGIFQLEFMIDVTPPTLTLNLVPAFDSGELGDSKTSLQSVSVAGQTEPFSRTALWTNDYFGEVTADENGDFQFDGIPLVLGSNTLNVDVTDLARNSSTVPFEMVRFTETGSLGPEEYGYVAQAVAYDFEDISSTGTRVLDGTTSTSIQLTSEQLIDFEISFYGRRYDAVYVSRNGLLTFETPYDFGPFGGTISRSPSTAAIAPYWTRLSSNRESSGVYFQLEGDGEAQRLIIQWNELSLAGVSEPLTFQTILSADGSIRINYQGVPVEASGNAVVGIRQVGADQDHGGYLEVARDSAPNELVGTELSTEFTRVSPDEQGPLLLAAFYDEFGNPAFTNQFRDFIVQGTLVDASPIVSFTGKIDGNPEFDLALLDNGSFQLDLQTLETRLAQPLDDGSHTLRLTSTDQRGWQRQIDLAFALDRAVSEFELRLAGASQPLEELIVETDEAAIQLVGTTDPYSDISFPALSVEAFADSEGEFELPDIELNIGENIFEIEVTDELGNSRTESLLVTRNA